METRTRNIADDVLEAVQRNVNPLVIRRMGELFEDLTNAYHNGYVENPYALEEIAKELQVERNYRDNEQMADECAFEIRYLLTGHREIEIEDKFNV